MGRADREFILQCVGGVSDNCCLSHQERNKNAAQELATLLLSLPAPASVQQQSKSLLASLHTSRSAYHSHKVIVPFQGGFGRVGSCDPAGELSKLSLCVKQGHSCVSCTEVRPKSRVSPGKCTNTTQS